MKGRLFLLGWVIILSSMFFMAEAQNNQLSSNLYINAHNAMKPNIYTNIDSMLVYRKGNLISENYYGKFTAKTTHRTHSTFKSINALITLIAIDQGILAIDEKVMHLLSRFGKTTNNSDVRKQHIKVKDLLDMTSGLACDEAPGSKGPNHEWGVDEGPEPLQYSMDIKMATEPGTEWHYCSANSFMLAATVSAALERAGRDDIFHFANKYLMKPLDIESKSYRFTTSQNGKLLNGQGNSHFLPEDLAKFGLLLLNKGVWKNKTIISEKAITQIYESSRTINWSFTDLIESQSNIKTTYSNQWYNTTFEIQESKLKVLHSWGNGGQYIFVVPALDAVVVFTGSNQGNFYKQKQPFDIMNKYVLPELMKANRKI
ncbi:MAG: serine hydrolase [Alcanivoracaceae bacterium]|nr:serine hydrolase [Alcanivoracaceae bacterium]